MISKIQLLKNLYLKSSKHSQYQVLSSRLEDLIDFQRSDQKQYRYERERLEYIKSVIELQGQSILDIGGNTGFFSFELIEIGARSVTFFEGNKDHALFVVEAAELLGYTNKIKVLSRHFLFNVDPHQQLYDITFNLNVLHHVGDDYGSPQLSLDKAKEQIIDSVNYLAGVTKYLILQLGFCWQGKTDRLLFSSGTKNEMINFVQQGTNQLWKMLSTGIACKDKGIVVYREINHPQCLSIAVPHSVTHVRA